MWLHSPDPLFREKVGEILRAVPPSCTWPSPGVRRREDGMQALGRKHPGTTTAARARRTDGLRVRPQRHAQSCSACWDVRTGEVYGEVRAQPQKAEDLVEFMEAVARRYPNGRSGVVWDNLNIHCDGAARAGRISTSDTAVAPLPLHPDPRVVGQQVELWFGILRGGCCARVFNASRSSTRRSLASSPTGMLNERKPFRWTFKGYPLQTGPAGGA